MLLISNWAIMKSNSGTLLYKFKLDLWSLIQELMLYKFKLCLNTTEATKTNKKINCGKDKCTVDHCSIIRWLKKFRLSSKNQVNESRLTSKPVDSKAVIQEANPVSFTRRVLSELDTSRLSVVRSYQIIPCIAKILQNF